MGFLAGGLIGAALGGMTSNKQQTQTQVQKADPWSGVQPYLSGLYRDAWDTGYPQYYPGQQVASPSAATNWAQQGILNKALYTDPTLGSADRQAQSTMNGGYLGAAPGTTQLNSIGAGSNLYRNPSMGMLGMIGRGGMLGGNPWVDATYGRAADAVSRQFKNTVMPNIASMYAGAGRYGSNAMDTAMGTAQQDYGKTLGDLATSIYGGNYANERGLMQQALGTQGSIFENERGLQQQALDTLGTEYGRERQLMTGMVGQAPTLQQAGYLPFQMASGVGSAQDQYQQNVINANKNAWDFAQNAPRDRLTWLNSLYSGAAPYASRSNTGASGVNPVLGAMGGFMMGQSLQNAMPSSGLFGGSNAWSQNWGNAMANSGLNGYDMLYG